MSRKYVEQMIEEIEFTNYQRYLQASLCPPMYSEFHNFYSNRCDWLSRGCFSPPYWLFPPAPKTSCESFHFLKRSDQFGFYKNCQGGKPLLKENEFHQGRWIPGKGARFCGESGRRHFTNWDGGPAFCRFKPSFDDGRHQRRNPGHSRNHSEKPMDQFQRYKNERLKSLENLSVNVKHASVENLHDSEHNSPIVPDEVTGKAAEAKTSSSNNSSAQLSEKSVHTPSPEIDNGYASWYNAEEQQQIVNMLKEVNMRHEQQLRRNSVLRSERPTSDDSTCSNADRTSLSSDDEDDGIVVLVSLEKDGPPPDDPDEQKDIANDYLEKSVSDYFEEFQSIFTVSPEKNIFNSLTKECMKECAKSKEKADEAVLMVEKESPDQNKQADDAEDKKGDDNLNAMAETESGIRDVEIGIASESDQREATTATGEDQSASLDEPRILFDATPSKSRDSEVQKFNETSNSIEQAASSLHELDDKRIEGLKTERKVSETAKNIEEAASSVYELNGKLSEGLKTERKVSVTSENIEEAASSVYELNGKRIEGLKTERKVSVTSENIEEAASSVYELNGKLSEGLKTERKVSVTSENIEEPASSVYELNGKLSEGLKTERKVSETSKNIEEAASSVYELNGKRSEGLKTRRKFNETSKNIEEVASSIYDSNGKSEEAAVLNSVQRNDKSGNICDLCSSRTDITKIVSQLRKKDVTTPLITKPLPLNTSQSRSSYCQPEIVYSFPNQTTVYMQNSWPVDYRIKRNTTDYKYKTNRLLQYPSEAINKSVETAFLKKFPCFIRQAGIPERKEAKSEPYLLRRNETKLQNNIPITSFSDSHLPFKGQNVNYKRITVEELFQTVSQNRKDRDVQKFGIKEDFSCELVTASDHLKKILKIGKGNESRIHSPALKNDNKFKDDDQKVGKYRDANMGSQFPYTSLLSGRYTPEGDKCGQKQILQTRDDPGKSTTAKAEQTSTRNNAYDSKPNYGVNSQTKYENAHKNYKQGKFAQFSQKGASSSLPGCGPTKPVNKAKSQNSDIVICKNHEVDTLPKLNSSKEGVEQKETMSKPKRRKKLKNDKTKAKSEGETAGKAAFVTSACNDKTDINQELRTGSDCGKYREKFDRTVPIKNSACTDEDKYCNSWKDRKRADSFLFSKKESGKFSETDCQSSNDLKTQISQQSSENRRSKVKAFASRKNNSSFSKSHEINKESTSAASQGLKNETLPQAENNSVTKRTTEKGNSNVGDLNILKLKTDGDDRHSGAESKNLKVRDSTHSRENPAPIPSNRKESPSKLRQKCAPKSFVSNRKVSDQEHLERDRSESPSKLRQKCPPKSLVSSKNVSDREQLERDRSESPSKLRQKCPPKSLVSSKNVSDREQLERDRSESPSKLRQKCTPKSLVSCKNVSDREHLERDRSESQSNLRQKCARAPRNFVSRRNFSDGEHLERDLAVRTRRNCDKLVRNYSEAYEKVSCSGKGNHFQTSNSFGPRKNSFKTKNKVSSSSGTVLSRTTDIKEKFVLESIYCYSKPSKIDDKNSVISGTNTTNVRKEEKRKHLTGEVKTFADEAKQNSLMCELEDDARQERTTGNAKESNDSQSMYAAPNLQNLQILNYSARMNICTRSFVSSTASKESQNIKIEDISNKKFSDYAYPSKECEISAGNQMCCFHEVDENIQKYLHSAQKLNKDIDHFIEDPGMPSENTSANSCSMNSICRQTEREKEGNGAKVARKTTNGDFTPMDKKGSGSDDGVGRQTAREKEGNGTKVARKTTDGDFTPMDKKGSGSDDGVGRQTEREKEGNGTKVARKTTDGDFTPMDKKGSGSDDGVGRQTAREKEGNGAKVARKTTDGDFTPMDKKGSGSDDGVGRQTAREKEGNGAKVARKTTDGDFTPMDKKGSGSDDGVGRQTGREKEGNGAKVARKTTDGDFTPMDKKGSGSDDGVGRQTAREKEGNGAKVARKTTDGDFTPMDKKGSGSDDGVGRQTAREKEGNGTKVARKTTDGDFTPMDKKGSGSDDGVGRQTEREKEGNGTKVARKTTDGDFTPMDKKGSGSDDGVGRQTEREKEGNGTKVARKTTDGDFTPMDKKGSGSDDGVGRQTAREKEGNGTKVARKTTDGDFTPMDKKGSGSDDGVGRQTEREKEGNGTKVARKTTDGDFTPMDKKGSGSDDGVCADGFRALCLRSEDICVESFADNSGKCSVVRQPPCYSAKDFPEKESVSDSDGQKSNHCVDSDQPTEDFIPEISALTLGHLSQPNEIESKCGDQIFKNASKDEDLFMGITSQEITKSVNCKQDIDSKVTSDVLGLPGTVLRKIHVPVPGGRLSCKMMLDASVPGEEYQVSNSLTRKASELLHCIASLNGAGAGFRPESDKAKTGESPEDKLQLSALNEETLPALQVSPMQTIVSSCNSDTESIGNSKKEKIGSESDLTDDQIVLLSDVAQVSKVLNTDLSLPQTNDIFNST